MGWSGETRAALEKRVSQEIEDIDADARYWVVCAAEETWSAEKQELLERWLAEDPRHEYAFSQARQTWSGVDQLSGLKGEVSLADLDKFRVADGVLAEPEARTPAGLARSRRSTSRLTSFAAAFAAAAAILLAVMLIVTPDAELNTFQTEVAEIRDVPLPDGSVITLGASTKVDIRFTDQERRVVLSAGEAFFNVSKDASRPFLVDARQAAIRVLGTQFNVRRGASQVDIGVAEGAVEVTGVGSQSATSAHKVILTLGQQVSSDRHGVLSDVSGVSQATLGAWRDGRLYYENASLAEVISDADRYYHGRIELASEKLARHVVSGSFRTDRVENMLKSLVATLPIRVVEDGANKVIISKDGGQSAGSAN